jgi:hypothetical protein
MSDQLTERPHIGRRFEVLVGGRHPIRGFEQIAFSDGIELLQLGDERTRRLRKSDCGRDQAPGENRKAFHIYPFTPSLYGFRNAKLLVARSIGVIPCDVLECTVK